MRIFHTSDWHLGQHFMGKSREPEHQAFLDWLLKEIQTRSVDALIVAGDLFDTGTPPSYARQMYNRFVVDLTETGCQLLVLGGNHDSVAMLEESEDLLHHLGVHLVARVREQPDEQLVTLWQKNRELPPGALVCAVPFIRARDVMKSAAGQDGEEKQKQLQNAIATHFEVLYRQAVIVREENQWQCPIIATGHLTTVGASSSDSVREIYIGSLEAFPASAFPPADYIALGHIHRAQTVAKNESIRYSGSPIPLSFDESGRGLQKSLVQIETDNYSVVSVNTVSIPQFRHLRTIRGDLESIEKQLSEFKTDEEDASLSTVWLEIIVSTEDYLNDLQRRIADCTQELDVEILLLRRERQQQKAALVAEQKQTLNEISVEDVFEFRLKDAFENTDDTDRSELQVRLKTLYRQVVSDVRDGTEQ